MRKILFGLIVFLLCVVPVLAVSSDFSFQITSSNPTPIGRPGTYDSHPSAIREDNGNIQVWYCGGGLNSSDPYFTHDSVFYAELNPQGQVIDGPMRVLAPQIGTQAPIAGDGWHACAPTVIKHRHEYIDPDGLTNVDGGPDASQGDEHYLMYYECARPAWFNDCDRVPIDQQGACRNFSQPYYAQICLAASNDGKSWMKFKNGLWGNPDWTNWNTTSLAEPVVPAS